MTTLIPEPRATQWNSPAPRAWDESTPRPHRIRCSSGWKGCLGSHESVRTVQWCWEARRSGAWPCDWLVSTLSEDGPAALECGAPAHWEPENGEGAFGCDKGHTHVPAQTRRTQGWDYAED